MTCPILKGLLKANYNANKIRSYILKTETQCQTYHAIPASNVVKALSSPSTPTSIIKELSQGLFINYSGENKFLMLRFFDAL
jgi:hypothetical protein